MKKCVALIVACFVSFYAFADTEIGSIDGKMVRYITLADGKTPMGHMYEDVEDLLGSRRDYYVFFGKEKFGPYQETRWIQYIPEKKALSYWAKIDEKYYFFVGKERQGPFDEALARYASNFTGLRLYAVKHSGGIYLISHKYKAGPFNFINELQFLSDDTLILHARKEKGFCYYVPMINLECKTLVPSPNGKTFSYIDSNKAGNSLYIGKQKLGVYKNMPSDLKFNPVNNTLAYTIQIEKQYYLFNGQTKLGPFSTSPYLMGFTADGKLIYGIRDKDRNQYLFCGKEKLGPVNDLKYFKFTLSKDRKHIAFVTYKNGKDHVFHDKKELGQFDHVDKDGLYFSPTENVLAFIAKVNDKYYMHIGDKKLGPMDSISNLTFSADGKSLAYTATINEKKYILLGKEDKMEGKEKEGTYDNIKNLNFLADGKLMYVANVNYNDEGLYIFGEGKKLEHGIKSENLIFSNNKANYVYKYRNEKGNYIYDGTKNIGPFEYEPDYLSFASDNKTLIYIDAKELYIGEEKIGDMSEPKRIYQLNDGKFLCIGIPKDKYNEERVIYIGKEKLGEFDVAEINYISEDKKTIEYGTKENDIWFIKVWMDGKSYIGSIVGEKIVYLDGNKIMMR